MKTLVGKKILSAKINPEKDIVVLETNEGNLYLSWIGDCCAHCFLANVSGSDNLIGSTILSAESTEWKDINPNQEEYGDVVETMGTKLKTTKGYVDFESRVEHNGFYGGEIVVNTINPLGQYGDNLVKLEDF